MPNITIQWYAGRTQQQKREIVAAITDAMVTIGQTTSGAVELGDQRKAGRRPVVSARVGWRR